MKKIKLLLIAPSFYPVHGGAGLRFFRYLPMFHVEDIETTVICGTPKLKKFTSVDHEADWINMVDGQLVDELEVEHAKIFKYKIPGKGARNRSKILLKKALMLCKNDLTKPDLVHVIAPLPFGVIKELRLLKKLGVKLVYSQTIAKEYSSNKLSRTLQQFKVKKVNACYDSIVVQSEEIKRIVLKTNAKADIHIIPNGVDSEKFSPIKNEADKNRLKEQLGFSVNAVLITLVGAVHPRKGTNLLVQAWSSLVSKFPNIHLVLIGPRYDETREELKPFGDNMREIIDSSGNEANVHFLGQVKNVDKYLQISDLFVFPSEREGMPNAVLEAMSTGLAVILTPFIGLSKEMGRDGSEYILSQRSSEMLAEKMLYILESDKLKNSLALSARNWIVKNMNVAVSVSMHTSLYKQLSL